MRYGIKSLLFVLFLTKEITSIRASYSASRKSDITKHLNSTIHKLFRSAKSLALAYLLKQFPNHEPKTYKYNLTREVEGFRDQIVFHNVTFPSWWIGRGIAKYIEYDFINNKIQIGIEQVTIRFCGDIYSDNDTYYGSYNFMQLVIGKYPLSSPDVEYNCVINVTKSPKTNTVVLQFSNMNNIEYEYYERLGTTLIEEIKSKLPSMLLENMNHNEKLIRALNKSYCFRPKRHLLAKRKNFSDNEYQYHYRIPTAQYFCFKLINISIAGLSNFQSLKHHPSLDKKPAHSHTLWIKDIRGNATLDYGRESETEAESPLKLNFHADYLTISRDKFTESYYGRGFTVGAHWSSVNRAEGDIPLTNVQSEGITRSIESAIAFSLMPQAKVREMETPLRQKCSEISQSLSWEDMKESYKKWIPFNDD